MENAIASAVSDNVSPEEEEISEPVTSVESEKCPVEMVSQESSSEGTISKHEEKKKDDPKPSVAQKKKPSRRRSSIGMQLMSTFLAPGTEEIMSPVEPRVRPKRNIPVRPPPAPVAPVKKVKPVEVRYSFDLGERKETKSCLKTTTWPILIGKGTIVPKPKSRTQMAASKVKEKYRNSANFGEATPIRRPSKLKFHNICSIRVMTPRADYDPERLQMGSPEGYDAFRERLSTVELQLTPQSEAMLDEMRETGVVQVNAQMVFGDSDTMATESSSDANNTAVEDVAFVEEAEKEPDVFVEKKKASRRKSVMLGSAAPLKSPAKIEQARDDDIVEVSSEPSTSSSSSRKSRRSVRLNPDAIEKPDEKDVILYEKEKEPKKKRDRDVPVDGPVEPNPKRSRRRSAYIKPDEEVTVDMDVGKEKKNTTIAAFFSPKHPKKTEEKVLEAEKERKSSRRSSAYFGTARVSKEKFVQELDEDVEIVEDPTPLTSSVIARFSSSSSSSSGSTLKIEEDSSAPPPTSLKLASIFEKPSAQIARVAEVKDNKISTPTSSPSSTKFFSMFSPKPKPKVVSESSSDTITVSDSPMVQRKPKSAGVQRKEHWGDRHPESYEFVLKMAPESSILEEEIIDEDIFNSRIVEDDVLSVGLKVESDLREVEQEQADFLIATPPEEITIEKLSVPEKCCPSTVFPSDMDHLVEGAEEKELICGWLKRWKKRVRKEWERELATKKQKQKHEGRRGRKRKDSEDSGDEFELDARDDDLENPLVLIGPTGVGKTALIRALAKQSNMRIISIGPDEERSGAEIKKKLQEAIRSHRVDQQPDRRISMFYKTVTDSSFNPKNSTPKEFVQSLVVFEHVDVFFEKLDRYGPNGLLEIVNDSSVPVIFTCENDWPRKTAQVELRRRFFEVRMGRNEVKIQKYVQKLIYSCRNVFLDDSTIQKLSTSVNHDLQSLIRQAHLFSLVPTLPFPITSRFLTSTGFEQDWERPREALSKKDERLEEAIEQHGDVLPDGIVKIHHPKKEKLWDADGRKLARKQSECLESVQNAFEALHGRYSRKSLVQDVLPLLVPIDRVERQKRAVSRRHLHRFKVLSDVPIDGDALIEVVGGWSISGRH
ncbi:hypothetical protein L3Y34_018934 [Caenorhabditis briggsae]|uniref:AAA+ ATPase domain-containing protein n=1 Tax=Caenorhabditis briggsae TaxID=6238 RepID=A0AAE9IW04_CAEBR|nr:hypothetical protein L3Y34_018934 [Caenorhabditis briggsae]